MVEINKIDKTEKGPAAEETSRMKTYLCRWCSFKTGSRKSIRLHVKERHGIRGTGEKSSTGSISSITAAYTSQER